MAIARVAKPGSGMRFASLYCGCGGLDLGFAKAGFEPVWANDLDPVAVATHNSTSLLGHKATVGDVAEVDWPDPGAADVVVGGPPCQGFSVAGKMDPGDPRSRHVWTFLDLVGHVKPQAFVMENVKALAIRDGWAMLREALRARASALGYRTRIHVLNAADYGVPQRRERMFLIGLLGADPPQQIQASPRRTPTVRDALKRLPPYGQPSNDTFCTARITPAKRPIMRPTPYRGSLLFNGNGRPLQPDAPAPTLLASMGGNCTPIIDQHELETGEESWVVKYHRHLLDGGSPLAKAPDQLRRITVEEAAALQTFPARMRWSGTTSARFRQIGNAVPPRLAYHVALALMESMYGCRRAIETTASAA